MKFLNFRNSHTNDNVIYSKKDIADMSVRDAFKNKDAIMVQNASIGVPAESELQSSPNAVYVHAYVKDDGTEVRAHWRSLPEGQGSSSPITNAIDSEVNTAQNNNSNDSSITGGAAKIDLSSKNVFIFILIFFVNFSKYIVPFKQSSGRYGICLY